MATFKSHPAISQDGKPLSVTIASGPVIIKDGQVLLDKHGDDEFWKFPGGKVYDNESFQQTAIREAREELGIDVVLSGDPCVLHFERLKNGIKEQVILLHYLASFSGHVTPGRDVREWAWHSISNLPKDCAPNIKPVVHHFTRQS